MDAPATDSPPRARRKPMESAPPAEPAGLPAPAGIEFSCTGASSTFLGLRIGASWDGDIAGQLVSQFDKFREANMTARLGGLAAEFRQSERAVEYRRARGVREHVAAAADAADARAADLQARLTAATAADVADLHTELRQAREEARACRETLGGLREAEAKALAAARAQLDGQIRSEYTRIREAATLRRAEIVRKLLADVGPDMLLAQCENLVASSPEPTKRSLDAHAGLEDE